jgi:hypothetical protein
MENINTEDDYIQYKHFKVAIFLDNNIENVDLLSHTEHKNKIEEKLKDYNIYFTKIKGVRWHEKFKDDKTKSPNRHLFIVETNKPDFFWYRYDTNSGGASGQHIYYKNKKIFVLQFLKKTDEKIREFLDL